MKLLFSTLSILFLYIGLIVSCSNSMKEEKIRHSSDRTVSDTSDSIQIDVEDSNRLSTPEELGIVVTPPDSLNYVLARKKALDAMLELHKLEEKGEYTPAIAAQKFEEILVNTIIPYWYGTPWDFNGYTNSPNDGVIACGYFVSTTLKHAGFILNRYDMAKQSAYNEAKTMALGEDVFTLRYNEVSKVVEDLEQFEDGIYICGLDFHVGFLYIKKGNPFFIHSNYIDAEGVIIERFETSEAIASSGQVVLAPLSTNNSLMQTWIQKEEIDVIFD